MADTATLDERLTAVERAVTGTEQDLTGLAETADLAERVDEIETRLDEIEGQLAEIEASAQAVRGYVGNVRSVNQEVEQRADLALTKVERLEQRFDEQQPTHHRTNQTGSEPGSHPRARTETGQDHPGYAVSGDDEPRWTAGAEPQRDNAAGQSRERQSPTRRRSGDGNERSETDDDGGGWLAGLTGSL